MTRHTLSRAAVIIVTVVSASACCRTSSPSESPGSTSGASAPAKTTPTDVTKPTAPPAVATPTPAATPAAAPGAMGPDGLPADIPATRSAVPTLAEWTAAKEITVRKSTPLNCETKMVREWLRVSCRRKPGAQFMPSSVVKRTGCGADTLLFSSGGVTSLVTPVLRGATCDTIFSWTAFAHELWVRWPNGAARPTIAFQD